MKKKRQSIELKTNIETEELRYRKLSIPALIIIFIVMYIVVMILIDVANNTINLGAGVMIGRGIVFYLYLMFILRSQLHYYEYSIVDQHLIVKDILSRRQKTIVVIPFTSILSIETTKQQKSSFYTNNRKVVKGLIRDKGRYFIEYDDYVDISVLEIMCSEAFINELKVYL